MYLNLVLEKFLIYNQIRHNGFYNIFDIQTDFKHNDIYRYALDLYGLICQFPLMTVFLIIKYFMCFSIFYNYILLLNTYVFYYLTLLLNLVIPIKL